MCKKIISIIFMLLPMVVLRGQTFEYGVDFSYFFDNLEFGDGPRNTGFDQAMTNNAMRLSPEVGIGLGTGDVHHKLMAGVDIMKDMGAGLKNKELFQEIFAYYNISAHLKNDACLSAIAGVFPRSFRKDRYNPLFFDEKVLFYDNNIEGFFFRYETEKLYADLGLDWAGKYGGGGDPTRRERFMILSDGRWSFAPDVELDWTARMDHYAGCPASWGVVDNHMVNPMLAWNTSNNVMDIIRLSAGGVFCYEKDRRADVLEKKGGLVARQKLEKCHVGVDNIFYLGGDLMPFYDQYGSDLYMSEECYHSGRKGSSWCDQIFLYYSPHIADWMDLSVVFAFHMGESLDGSPVFRGWQQMLSLKVDL